MDHARKHSNAQSSFNGWRLPGGWGWAGRHVMIRPDLSRPTVARQGLETGALVGLATAEPSGDLPLLTVGGR